MEYYVVFIFAGVLCLLILGFSFFIYKREVLILDLRHENKVLNDRVEGFHRLERERHQEEVKFKTHPIGEIYEDDSAYYKEVFMPSYYGLQGKVRVKMFVIKNPYSTGSYTPPQWRELCVYEKGKGWVFTY